MYVFRKNNIYNDSVFNNISFVVIHINTLMYTDEGHNSHARCGAV
jgi:hypothetical protein